MKHTYNFFKYGQAGYNYADLASFAVVVPVPEQDTQVLLMEHGTTDAISGQEGLIVQNRPVPSSTSAEVLEIVYSKT